MKCLILNVEKVCLSSIFIASWSSQPAHVLHWFSVGPELLAITSSDDSNYSSFSVFLQQAGLIDDPGVEVCLFLITCDWMGEVMHYYSVLYYWAWICVSVLVITVIIQWFGNCGCGRRGGTWLVLYRLWPCLASWN